VRAFESGTRTVFLYAPVGSGKSLIHLLAARESGSAYITTPQVMLVDQYGHDSGDTGKFRGLAKTLYGRRNYPCPHVRERRRGNRNATADGAPCTYREGWPRACPELQRCPYYLGRHEAQLASTTVTTLAYAVLGVMRRVSRQVEVEDGQASESVGTTSVLGPGWRERSLLVVDEAHGLPEDLVTFFAVEVGKETLPGFDFGGIEKSEDPLQFMREQLPPYLLRLLEGFKELRVSEYGGTEAELQALDEQRKLIQRTQRFIENLARDDVAWVHTYEAMPPKHRWRPLSAAPFAGPLWEHSSRILLSSATFFGFDTLERALGLPGPFQVIEVPDTFPATSAPIHLVGSVTLRKDTMAAQLPEVVRELSRIASLHTNQRGLVHCNAYQIRNFIEKHADETLSRRLVFHSRDDRNASLQGWMKESRPDSIFVAVAMSEGLDLGGDLARWQVIVKAPFPNLGDPWVLRRRDEPGGRAWYAQQAVIDILQACGRIMRSHDDRGTTYILDKNAGALLRRNWDALPLWFKVRADAGLAVPGVAKTTELAPALERASAAKE
jgi:Rad3-related DNA helicase